MKKLIGVVGLFLITAAGGLCAQTTIQKDSMMGTMNKTTGDSMKPAQHRLQRDSMMSLMNGTKGDSMMPSNNKMAKDKTMANVNKMAAANTMPGDNKMVMDKKEIPMPDVSTWPKASQMAVQEITTKYGKPDGVTGEEIFWMKKGVWNKICITKMESKHSFPIEHTDMMQTTISYKVPEDKMDELGKFDGSVTFDRTQGTISARCDKEANNFLALNLANDIITGKKTVEQARKAYGDIVKAKMGGADPAYMQKLNFSAQANTADPDKNTTGLTKMDVAVGIEKNKMHK